jgi:hypothetical protein
MDHIIAQQHHGISEPENLCLACATCNAHKGPNIAGIDSQTGQLVRLFHPRRDTWSDHFRWNGPVLQGLTDVARVTIDVLSINDPARVILRSLCIQAGDFSPSAR